MIKFHPLFESTFVKSAVLSENNPSEIFFKEHDTFPETHERACK